MIVFQPALSAAIGNLDDVVRFPQVSGGSIPSMIRDSLLDPLGQPGPEFFDLKAGRAPQPSGDQPSGPVAHLALPLFIRQTGPPEQVPFAYIPERSVAVVDRLRPRGPEAAVVFRGEPVDHAPIVREELLNEPDVQATPPANALVPYLDDLPDVAGV